MDQSIRRRRPEDGPSPYCGQSAHSITSGPETAPDPRYEGRNREPKTLVRRSDKLLRVPALKTNLPAAGA